MWLTGCRDCYSECSSCCYPDCSYRLRLESRPSRAAPRDRPPPAGRRTMNGTRAPPSLIKALQPQASSCPAEHDPHYACSPIKPFHHDSRVIPAAATSRTPRMALNVVSEAGESPIDTPKFGDTFSINSRSQGVSKRCRHCRSSPTCPGMAMMAVDALQRSPFGIDMCQACVAHMAVA
jgi:hypothetical protein